MIMTSGLSKFIHSWVYFGQSKHRHIDGAAGTKGEAAVTYRSQKALSASCNFRFIIVSLSHLRKHSGEESETQSLKI